MNPILELRDVSAAYGKITVLRGVNVSVMPGQIVALLGPNGQARRRRYA